MSNEVRTRGKAFPLLSIGVSFVLSSCMTMADYNYAHIDANLAAGNYAAVSAELEANAPAIYGSHDEVLRLLDAGLVAHFDGKTAESNQALSEAETLMEAYSAKSVTQTVASLVTNDLVQDYAGEDFEDIYANIFMALNYLAQGEQDEAMVEIRRFDNKLKNLRTNYEIEIRAAENADNETKVKKVSIQFYDSALARYVSMLLYRAQGDSDNAAVDYNLLQSAFRTQADLYDFALPKSIAADRAATKQDARLNVLAFYGRAPLKKEDIVRAYSWEGTIWYKLALPVMEKRPSAITSVVVTANNKATGERHTQTLEKLESLENICMDTFQQRYSLLYAKALARSVAKTAANTTMHVLAKDADDAGSAVLFTLLDIATKVSNELTERADVRTSRYFPASASIAGITLPAGDYTVTVQFFAGRHVTYTETKDMRVRAGALNFVEAACLR